VALTFDDGPTEFTPKFLDLLKENEVKATFFCIGKQIEKYPETFQRIIAEGHTLEIILVTFQQYRFFIDFKND
jgi:peptidoglycan/xylan/chitin deacetylase (PgdA/CDA1 family)